MAFSAGYQPYNSGRSSRPDPHEDRPGTAYSSLPAQPGYPDSSDNYPLNSAQPTTQPDYGYPDTTPDNHLHHDHYAAYPLTHTAPADPTRPDIYEAAAAAAYYPPHNPYGPGAGLHPDPLGYPPAGAPSNNQPHTDPQFDWRLPDGDLSSAHPAASYPFSSHTPPSHAAHGRGRTGSGSEDDPFLDRPHRPDSPTDFFSKDVDAKQAGGASRTDSAHGSAKKPGSSSSTRHQRPPKRSRRRPYAIMALTLIQVGAFLYEFIRSAILTGTPVATKPAFNPTLGPSTFVLINSGALFAPCMRKIDVLENTPGPHTFPCPNATTTDTACSLGELCGWGGVPSPGEGGSPNQWFRFIVPVFLHAGLVHIGFNMLLQWTLARDIEIKIGPWRFLAVYLAAGVFGFVFGGNFNGDGIASTGASGALCGIIAINLLDLLYRWRASRPPYKELAFVIVDIVITFLLGLLPGIDNFAHIGGFLMGLASGLCILHTPRALRHRIESRSGRTGTGTGTGITTTTTGTSTFGTFRTDPVGFFRGRKVGWWAWWIVRIGALVAMLVAFIVLLNNFYNDGSKCSWCKYLSCVPISDWCEAGDLKVTQVPAK